MKIDAQLPGAEVVEQGVADLRAGRRTPQALAVTMASQRLRTAGVDVPQATIGRASHELYDVLAAEHGADAHGRYNALVRRIASFARAAEHAAKS